jgi:saccharopine dehydrogenase-like NADP-dependent oxidoreductase
MKVVVLGGYGNFGARISKALARDPAIELVVAARDGARAQAFAQPIGATGAAIDTTSAALAEQLHGLGAGLVIHTAGPFQGQGHGVAQAAATAGCHYIDLADGRRFVCDFAARMDRPFRIAGRTAITGASTVPALSSAVADALLPRFAQLHGIDFCIAPSQQAPRGVATVAGVLSYCGLPIPVWRDGQWQTLHGWADPQPVRFGRLKPRLGALCDIPDLELFPQHYPGVRDVMFRAALEVGFTQRGFALLARLRQWGLLEEPQRFAAFLNASGRWFDRFGTPDGGMVVRLRGLDAAQRPLQLAGHITAPDHHGPEIPCMAAILLARRIARGEPMPAGARPCLSLLRLQEFEPEFARWGMTTEVLEEPHGA